MLLGLFCWFLTKVFPRPEEFQEFNVKPGEEFLFDDTDPLKNGQISKQFKGREKFYRQCVQHLKNKYTLSFQIYSLIKYACYRNQKNQLYFFKFQNDFAEHIGYGDFVKEALEFCFQGNFQILHSLHQIQFVKRISHQQQNQFQKKSKSKNFFQFLVKKLKKMEPYTKSDILSLLASFCVFNNSSIYINQEKIFSGFIDNRQIIFNTLLKIREEIVDNQKDMKKEDILGTKFFQKKRNFFIEIKKRQPKSLEYDIVTLNLNLFDKKYIKKNSSIELYSNMCANRNFTSGKAFGDIFPQNTLMDFIEEDHSTELRARMCKLQRNLYIDKEPRLIIQKPNLVRIFISQDDRLNDKEICPFIFDPVILKMIRQPKLKKKKENQVYLQSMKKKFERYLKKQEETEIYIQFIKNNAKEDYELIKKNQLFIRRELKKCFQAIMKMDNMKIDEKNYPDYYQDKDSKQNDQFFTQTPNQDIYNSVFNNLTYEIIKNFHLMLKYGFFTRFANLSNDPDHIKDPIKIFKDIISYLSFILEFEIDYTSELIKNGASQAQSDNIGCLKRKYIKNIEKQIEEQKEGISLLSIKNIGGEGMKLFTDLTKVLPLKTNNEEDEEEEDGGVKGSGNETDSQSQLNFLNTYQSLQKLLTKFTNKTYKMKNMEIRINKDLETLIKIEICEIFEYIMDWREDFFIQNAMNYFTDVFYENNKFENNYQKNPQDLEKEISQLFPENMFAVGQPVLTKKRKFKKLQPKKTQVYDPNLYYEEVENIDDIIRRPFAESLMIGFYFSEDPDLQNKFANLIYRSFTQKKKFVENIFKINLVNSGSSDRSYQQMSKLISRLKALISYSQSWLQIIEQDVYNEKAEENLEVTLSKLTKLYEQFEGKSEELEIKQKIFKHLEGHKVILKFLEQGTSVLQTNSHYFTIQNQEQQQFSYKKVFMYSVINVFKTCHKILSIFCLKNQKIQKTLFKHYHKLLFNQSYLNIGQVEFICEIFRGNRDLSLANNSKYIDYTINLIKIHGMQPEFLDLFEILIENKTIENYEIQKRIIQTLLDSKIINIINIFILQFKKPFKTENLIEQKRRTIQYIELLQSEKQIENSRLQSLGNLEINTETSQKTPKLQIVGFEQTKNIEQQGDVLENNDDQANLETENSEVQQNLKNNFDINVTIKFYEQCQTQNQDVLEKRLKEYKLKFIQIISTGFTTSEIGVNFIYRSFLHIRVQSLFQMLFDEMKIKQNKNINDKNVLKQLISSRKQAITDLLLTYFYKLDQSIQDFQKSSQIFMDCIECEIINLRSKYNYSQEEKEFIIHNFLPLINEYSDNFLKDSVLLAIQKNENSVESQNQKIIIKFADLFLQQVSRFIDFTQFKKLDNRTTQRLKNIAILANNFRIKFNPPEILQQLINVMAIENKEAGGQQKEHTSLNKYNQPTKKQNGQVFQKFKNCVNAIIFLKKAGQDSNSVHFDQLNKLERESRYLKLWNTFKNQIKNTKQLILD